MRERIVQGKKAASSVSIPTLKQPTRGFGLDSLNASPSAATQAQPINKPITHDISRISLRPQAKLTIGQPGDSYEQEADSVAQQVMQRMAQPGNRQSIQRQEAPEEEEELQMKSLDISTLQRQEAPEEEEELQMSPMVQRQGQGGMAATPDLETSINQARGGGQPLGDNIRKPMEQAFGADFGGVKVHTDSRSDQLNQSIQARAFTTGQDVFFRQGEYNPGSRGGQELLAHELTHVVQQTQKANNTNLSTKKVPACTARPLKIQSSHSTVQRANGYENVKKSEDPEVVFHKKLGKELVATYRILSKVTDAIREGKNRGALKEGVIGLAKAGISVATMLSGIPGLTAGTDVLSGDIVLNTGVAPIGQAVGSTGAGIGLGAQERVPVSQDVTRAVENTTTGGVLKNKIHDKVGNLKNAANTLMDFIPFFEPAKLIYKGAKQAATSKDEWNSQKGKLVGYVRDIQVNMKDAISQVNIEDFGDLEIVTSNSKNFLRHSRRTLEDVLTKYQEKSKELEKAIEEWSSKHEEHKLLLTAELDEESCEE